jgi:hypothetical protein
MLTFKTRQEGVDFVKRRPIAPVVTTRSADTQLAARECVGDDVGNFPHAIVFLGMPDVILLNGSTRFGLRFIKL